MKLFGSVVSFVLPDQSQAERFLQSCELVYEATSFGVIHTTAERSARWGGDKSQMDLFVGVQAVRTWKIY